MMVFHSIYWEQGTIECLSSGAKKMEQYQKWLKLFIVDTMLLAKCNSPRSWMMVLREKSMDHLLAWLIQTCLDSDDWAHFSMAKKLWRHTIPFFIFWEKVEKYHLKVSKTPNELDFYFGFSKKSESTKNVSCSVIAFKWSSIESLGRRNRSSFL